MPARPSSILDFSGQVAGQVVADAQGDIQIQKLSYSGDAPVVSHSITVGAAGIKVDNLPIVSASFVFTQGSPASTWSVVHNLARYPAVDVVDTGNTVLLPDVHYDDANTLTVSFGAPTSGQAFLN